VLSGQGFSEFFNFSSDPDFGPPIDFDEGITDSAAGVRTGYGHDHELDNYGAFSIDEPDTLELNAEKAWKAEHGDMLSPSLPEMFGPLSYDRFMGVMHEQESPAINSDHWQAKQVEAHIVSTGSEHECNTAHSDSDRGSPVLVSGHHASGVASQTRSEEIPRSHSDQDSSDNTEEDNPGDRSSQTQDEDDTFPTDEEDSLFSTGEAIGSDPSHQARERDGTALGSPTNSEEQSIADSTQDTLMDNLEQEISFASRSQGSRAGSPVPEQTPPVSHQPERRSPTTQSRTMASQLSYYTSSASSTIDSAREVTLSSTPPGAPSKSDEFAAAAKAANAQLSEDDEDFVPIRVNKGAPAGQRGRARLKHSKVAAKPRRSYQTRSTVSANNVAVPADTAKVSYKWYESATPGGPRWHHPSVFSLVSGPEIVYYGSTKDNLLKPDNPAPIYNRCGPCNSAARKTPGWVCLHGKDGGPSSFSQWQCRPRCALCANSVRKTNCDHFIAEAELRQYDAAFLAKRTCSLVSDPKVECAMLVGNSVELRKALARLLGIKEEYALRLAE